MTGWIKIGCRDWEDCEPWQIWNWHAAEQERIFLSQFRYDNGRRVKARGREDGGR